ncbi:aldo/keto reductase [Egicoccus sp. AB-alg6-2]|uniref:aldo/keto reductase n=1 Tax=Egicoccus sp. AB-alg6-2 TaxID=3242692 RepID=UPI00359DF57F
MAPLRVPAYRRVWMAMTVSHLGTYLQLSAAPWLMHEMTRSPLMVSLVTSALLLPRLVLTLPAGALSDVIDRRTIMLVAQAVSALATGSLAVVVAMGALTPNWLLAFTLLLGVGSAIDKPSHQTMVPDLVPAAMRAQAITLNSGAHHAARVVGPSIGGLLVALEVAELAFAGNAVSFLLVMAVLRTLPRDRETADARRAAGRNSAAEGIRFVRSQRGLRRLLVITALFTLSSASVQALLPSVVAEELGIGARGFGVLYGIFGAGALLATVSRERMAMRWGPHMVPVTMGIFGLGAMAFGMADGALAAGAALTLTGLAWVWTMTTLNATVQLSAPAWVRGRVVALYVLAVAMKPVGAFISGTVAEVVGAGRAVTAMSMTTVLLALAAARMHLPVLGDNASDGSEPTMSEHAASTSASAGRFRWPDVPFAGRSLPPLALGCMSMTHPGRSERDARATLQHAFEAGVRMFDTADRYGRGHNEVLVGEALRHVRDEVVIATKFGFVGKPGRDERVVDGSPAYVHAACEASLTRLGTDRIDLYYLHRVDPGVPVEETVGAMAELVTAGKVVQLGLSEVDVGTLERARSVHPIAAVQSEYSLTTRDVERGVLPACLRGGSTFVAYSPLGIGLLTGRYGAPRELPEGNRLARGPRMQDEHRPGNLRRVEELRRLAAELGATPAQVALAWVLAHGVVALPGSSRRQLLEENLGALELELDDDVRERLDALFPPGSISGARKPPPGLALTPG